MNKNILLAVVLAIYGCDSKEASKAEFKSGHEGHNHQTMEGYYTCSMHPQIKEKEPGKCPICYMALTYIEVDSEEQLTSKVAEQKTWMCKDFPDITSEKEDVCPIDGSPMVLKQGASSGDVVANLRLRKAQMDHFRPAYFEVTKMKMNHVIRLLGSILPSEEKESKIPARISGRVDKVYIKSTGSYVKRGDPVVSLFSPKLITAGEEYIVAKKSYINSKSKSLKDILSQSESRLKQWGITEKQYESWYRSGKVPQNIIIYSDSTGVVRKRNATLGKYFKEGENFFELSDLSNVWVEMDVYEHESNLVKIGQKVELEFIALPGEKFIGEVDFVSPVLDSASRTLKIRTTILNSFGKLKPGMVADASLVVEKDDLNLVVPRTAVVNTGKRKVVWIKKDDSSFYAKVIETRYESEGYVEVVGGLVEGDMVVLEGNFLLDAQAQLFGGYEKSSQ